MSAANVLEKIGLKDKQAQTYLATLELGTATAIEIATKANMKRSTTYVILDELSRVGLVSSIKKGSTTLYTAKDPEILRTQLEERLQAFHSVHPFLNDLFTNASSAPNVKYYSGEHEVTQLYRQHFYEYTHIDFFGVNIDAFSKKLPKVFEMYNSEVDDGTHNVREIFTCTKFNIEHAKKYTSRFHPIRIIGPQYSFFGDNAIVGNTLLITSLEQEPFSVTIESTDVAKTFRSLFAIAWDTAKHPRDITKKMLISINE